MSDEDLKRILGMNVPLAALSLSELDALIHRVSALSPAEKAQVEAILVNQEGFPKSVLDEVARRAERRMRQRERCTG